MDTNNPSTQNQTQVQPTQTAPATNPMLSQVAPPPAPEQLLNQQSAQTQVTAPVVPDQIPAPTPVKSDSKLKGITATDPTIKVAVTYIGSIADKVALDIDRAIGHSLDSNDTRFIDEAYIRETIKDKAEAEHTITMLKAIVEHQATTAQKTVSDVYALAGGEANWKSAVAYFNKSASADSKAGIAAALDSGKPELVKLAVQQVIAAAKEAGAVVQHQQIPLGGNNVEKGISRAEMAQRLSQRGLTEAQHADIRRLRLLGIQQGI